MTKTQAERNADYQFRLRTRSSHFGHLNDLRCERLLQSSRIVNDPSPEAKTIVAFFTAYPRCERLPHMMDTRKGVVVILPKDANAFEAAAAAAALAETTSAETSIMRATEGRGFELIDTQAERGTVVHEVAELRDAGLWRTTFARDA
jgi:hypothetical protein